MSVAQPDRGCRGLHGSGGREACLARQPIEVDLIKGWALQWPRLENEHLVMCIGSARPLEDAARIAYADLVLWMEAEYGFDRWDAYMMLSQCGKVRLGNFVDPKYTVGAGIEKKYLVDA